jgi:hypothetical protein
MGRPRKLIRETNGALLGAGWVQTRRGQMADSGWRRSFDEPIPLPRGRELVTLEDAASYSNATANRSKLTHVPITGAFQTRETTMKNLVVAAAFAAFSLSPASAKMMACRGENLAKMTDHLATMPQTPKRTAMMPGDCNGQY